MNVEVRMRKPELFDFGLWIEWAESMAQRA